MGDFLTGFWAGGLTILAIMHLIYQKRLTKNGWVEKEKDVSKFWMTTAIYFLGAFSAILFMLYT